MAEIKQYVDLNLNQNQLVASVLENRTTDPASPRPGQWYFNSASNRFMGWNGTIWVDLSQVLNSAITLKGEIANAASNPAYPTGPSVGDIYFITTQAGTVGGQLVDIGDQLFYSTSGWYLLQANLQAATTTIAGYLALATPAEAVAGLVANKAITPLTLGQTLTSGSYVRRVVGTVNLTAYTGSIVTHGFSLTDPEALHIQTSFNGERINLAVSSSSANAVTITSNQNLNNVKVIFEI